jgi:Lar family restriction alleviation protein
MEEWNLKPCPFCGGLAEIIVEPAFDYAAQNHFVRCQKCQVKGQKVYQRYHDIYEKSKAQAVLLWNARSHSSAP